MRIFKKDLQLPVEAIVMEMVPAMIETAVLKAQVKLLQVLMHETSHYQVPYHTQNMERYDTWKVLVQCHKYYSRQLDQIATTELTLTDAVVSIPNVTSPVNPVELSAQSVFKEEAYGATRTPREAVNDALNDIKCIDCAFLTFAASTGYDGELTEHTGFCHRYPPVLADQSPDSDKYESYMWTHPVVDLLQGPSWCGEFKPEEPQGKP